MKIQRKYIVQYPVRFTVHFPPGFCKFGIKMFFRVYGVPFQKTDVLTIDFEKDYLICIKQYGYPKKIFKKPKNIRSLKYKYRERGKSGPQCYSP